MGYGNLDLWFVVRVALATAASIAALSYFQRAHGLTNWSGPSLAMGVFYMAAGALPLVVLAPLRAGIDNVWHFAGGCLVLATLVVTPWHLMARLRSRAY